MSLNSIFWFTVCFPLCSACVVLIFFLIFFLRVRLLALRVFNKDRVYDETHRAYWRCVCRIITTHIYTYSDQTAILLVIIVRHNPRRAGARTPRTPRPGGASRSSGASSSLMSQPQGEKKANHTMTQLLRAYRPTSKSVCLNNL